METRGGRIEGAVQRLLEGQKSAPETPPNRLFSELSAGSHPQDDVQEKRFEPSQELLDGLEALTVEAGPTLDILKEQADGSKINGAVLDAAVVAQPRMEAIKWISSKFAAFGFRDEWLADAVFYMDRLAVQMHKSDNFHPLGLEANSSAAEIQAASEAMKSQDLWLASVMIALKMSEAESELDTSIQDLVVPLVPFNPSGLKCNRARWQKIKLTEFFVVRELDSRLMVPTTHHFVQHLSREVQRVAVEAKADWPGLATTKLPVLIGPPLPGKEQQEEQRQKERQLTQLQALAQYLADMAVAHKPSTVYGDKLSPAVLAVTVLRLALYGWGAPPRGSEERLDELQEELDIKSAPEEERHRLLAEVYRLWQRVPSGFMSPVTDRWRKRELKVPLAPGQETLSPLLQDCCCFLTPLKKKQEPKDLSATPGSRPVQEDLASSKKPGDPAGDEPQGPEVRQLFPDASSATVEDAPALAVADVAQKEDSLPQPQGDAVVEDFATMDVEEAASTEAAMDVDDEVVLTTVIRPPKEEDLQEEPNEEPKTPMELQPAAERVEVVAPPIEPKMDHTRTEVAPLPVQAPATAKLPPVALEPFPKNRPGKNLSLGAPAVTVGVAPKAAQQDCGFSAAFQPLQRIREELGQPSLSLEKHQPVAAPVVVAPGKLALEGQGGEVPRCPTSSVSVSGKGFPANSQPRGRKPKAKPKARGPARRSLSATSGHSSDATFSPGTEESISPSVEKRASRKRKRASQATGYNALNKYKRKAYVPMMQASQPVPHARPAPHQLSASVQLAPPVQPTHSAQPAPHAQPAHAAQRTGSAFTRSISKSQALDRRARFEKALKGNTVKAFQEIEDALALLEGEPTFSEDEKRAQRRMRELEEHFEQMLERCRPGLVQGASLLSSARKLGGSRESLERLMKKRALRGQPLTLD